MDILNAIILGIIQGLTEFLPVSSDGHLELGKIILGTQTEESLGFTIAVHGATVLSTIVVFRNEIWDLIKGFFQFKMNSETDFILKIFVSMIPVGFVGFFLKDQVEALFEGNLLIVGIGLLGTASVLFLSKIVKREKTRPIGYLDSFIIGIAQALAVFPGLSRSGSTISTGLMLGNSKQDITRFSFLMVIIPILGMNFLELIGGELSTKSGIGFGAIAAGFISAFIAGYLACSWMISIVKKGKLIWFALYCAIVGSVSILFYFI